MVEFSFTNLVVVGSGAVALTVINTDEAYVKMSRCLDVDVDIDVSHWP